MKKALSRAFYLSLLSVACVMVSSGCKKSGNDGPDHNNVDYYISFKADGVQKKYTSQAIATLGYSSQDKLYNGILQGYPDPATAEKSHIGIVIFDNKAIAAGTYQDPQKAANGDGDKITKVMLNYNDEAGNGYLSMGAMVDEDGNPFPGANNVVADGKITVTKLTSTSIEGTFSGTTFLSTDATFNNKVAITEGKFILKRLQ
jgi:hypothetical protein